MPADIVMPQLGLTMTEGKVLQWYKAKGERFEAGEPLFEVETDKVNMDVEATESGTLLEILGPLNETLPVTTVIGRYTRDAGETTESGPADSSASDAKAKSKEAHGERTAFESVNTEDARISATSVNPEKQSETRRLLASPRARRAARDLEMSLDAVRGSGPQGRIVEQDVLLAAEKRTHIGSASSDRSRGSSRIPISKVRRTTAERMSQSFQSAPHFYITREVDAAELLAMKRMLSSALTKNGGGQISVTDLLVKAMALAIASHPAVNASWKDGQLVERTSVDIGLAVAHDNELLVAVMREVVHMDIGGVAEARSSLVERVRSRRAQPDDFGSASGTLSNLGMYGVDQFQAILNPPESIILATGRIRDRVVAVNGTPAVRPTMLCTVSADHRVLDGVQVAQFVGTFAEILENPALLLLPSRGGR